MRQNTKKATVITDERGRTLFTGATRPGLMHDQTAVKSEDIEDLFEQYPRSGPRWALTPNSEHGLCGLCQRSWCVVEGVIEGDR